MGVATRRKKNSKTRKSGRQVPKGNSVHFRGHCDRRKEH
jgi:hypothetical protein